jgi:hypothetical protein
MRTTIELGDRTFTRLRAKAADPLNGQGWRAILGGHPQRLEDLR